MHAFLTATNADCPYERVSSPDVFHVHPDPTTIGIGQIRNIIEFLSRKPLQSPHLVVVVHSADLLTLPAQNALLKTLEEPPPSVLIYLISPHPDALLPTILSRVQSIRPKHSPPLSPDPKWTILWQKISSARLSGERLALMDSAGFTRESLTQFFTALEVILHHNLVSAPDFYPLLRQSQKYLIANVNLRLILTNFCLRLPPVPIPGKS